MKKLLIITALALLLPAAGLCWTTSDAMRAVVAAKNESSGSSGIAEIISSQSVTLTGETTDPTPINLTVPDYTTTVYVFWAYWNSTSGNGLSSATLGGSSYDAAYELPTPGGDYNAIGLLIWHTGAGTKSLDISWDIAPDGGSGGPSAIAVYTKGAATSIRDEDKVSDSGALSVTIDSAATDIVLKADVRYETSESYPSVSTGWTSVNTNGQNRQWMRVSSADSPGAASTVCNSEDENYSSLFAVSIPAL